MINIVGRTRTQTRVKCATTADDGQGASAIPSHPSPKIATWYLTFMPALQRTTNQMNDLKSKWNFRFFSAKTNPLLFYIHVYMDVRDFHGGQSKPPWRSVARDKDAIKGALPFRFRRHEECTRTHMQPRTMTEGGRAR